MLTVTNAVKAQIAALVNAVLGATPAWFSDNDTGPSNILAHHWPNIPNLGDIKTINWTGMKAASMRKLTPDQSDSAVQMYDSGMSLAPIAEYYGVSRQAMWDKLRRRTAMRPQARFGSDNHFWRGGTKANERAHDIVEKAVLAGRLIRSETCERCGGDGRKFRDGRAPIQAHHCDYNKPLDVMWLCQPCHHEWHKTNTAIAVEGGDAKGSLADIDVLTGGFP